MIGACFLVLLTGCEEQVPTYNLPENDRNSGSHREAISLVRDGFVFIKELIAAIYYSVKEPENVVGKVLVAIVLTAFGIGFLGCLKMLYSDPKEFLKAASAKIGKFVFAILLFYVLLRFLS